MCADLILHVVLTYGLLCREVLQTKHKTQFAQQNLLTLANANRLGMESRCRCGHLALPTGALDKNACIHRN